MEFRALNNGQIMKIIRTFDGDKEIVEEIHHCMLKETNKKRIENQYKVCTLEFNTETGMQEITNEVYEPIPTEILLQELKAQYLALIKDVDLLGDETEKERLQQEYLQKKSELENTQ